MIGLHHIDHMQYLGHKVLAVSRTKAQWTKLGNAEQSELQMSSVYFTKTLFKYVAYS